MAVAAKLGYCGCKRFLCVGIVTGLTLDTSLTMTTMLPLIGGELMARGAQFMIWIDGHTFFGVTLDVGAVTGFAGHAFIRILTETSLKAGCMAFKAVEFSS